MWFKNAKAYRITKQSIDAYELENQLPSFALCPCGPSAMQSIGWVAPRAGGQLTHVVNGQILISLGVEQRILPASVVKRFAADKALVIEEQEGRRVGRKEMRELREAAALELMPKSFIINRSTSAWIDPVNGWLVVDAASPAKAEELLELLRKSVDGLTARIVDTEQSPSAAMTGWVASGEAPSGFTLDQDLFLRSAEKSEVRYVRHTLDGDDAFDGCEFHSRVNSIVLRGTLNSRPSTSPPGKKTRSPAGTAARHTEHALVTSSQGPARPPSTQRSCCGTRRAQRGQRNRGSTLVSCPRKMHATQTTQHAGAPVPRSCRSEDGRVG